MWRCLTPTEVDERDVLRKPAQDPPDHATSAAAGWSADAVAGAVLAAERGDVSWVDRLSLSTTVEVVRVPPERA
jgi:hypothetical protein